MEMVQNLCQFQTSNVLNMVLDEILDSDIVVDKVLDLGRYTT